MSETTSIRDELTALLLRHGHVEWEEFDATTVADVVLESNAIRRIQAEAAQQERERADHAIKQWDSAEVNVEELAAELARAQECIEEVRRIQMFRVGITAYGEEYMRNVHKTIADYDKGSSDV